MSNTVKIIIGIVIVALIGYAIAVFDIGRDGVDDGDGVSDLIRVTVPVEDALIQSPATFSGEARGTWFFEATFPIDIRANDGTVIGRGYAEAQDEWMTEEFVPWIAIVSFDPKGNTSGLVRFMKDNPSGLPENDAYIDVPVRFAAASGTSTTTSPIAKQCKPSGCSAQICSDEDAVTTCEFRPEYACYRTAKCERQSDGRCGWTETTALRSCLNNPPQE